MICEVLDFWLDLYHCCQESLFYTGNCYVSIKVYFTAGKQPYCKTAWHNWKSNFCWKKTAFFSAVARTALKQCLFYVERNIFLVISELVFARRYTPISFTLCSLSLPKLLSPVRARLPATAPQSLIFIHPKIHIHTGTAYGFTPAITY